MTILWIYITVGIRLLSWFRLVTNLFVSIIIIKKKKLWLTWNLCCYIQGLVMLKDVLGKDWRGLNECASRTTFAVIRRGPNTMLERRGLCLRKGKIGLSDQRNLLYHFFPWKMPMAAKSCLDHFLRRLHSVLWGMPIGCRETMQVNFNFPMCSGTSSIKYVQLLTVTDIMWQDGHWEWRATTRGHFAIQAEAF